MATVLPPQIFAAKVAILYSAGYGLQKIADTIRSETGNGDTTTHRDVSKIISTEEFKSQMASLTDAMMQQAKTQLRSSTARLVPKIMSTIEANLDRNNLNAVPHALNILGFSANEEKKADTTLNIILPSTNERALDAIQNPNTPDTIQLVRDTESETKKTP